MTSIKKIEELAQAELAEANEKYPPFASMHEAYAVILEEVDEAKMDMKRLELIMGWLWESVKRNEIDIECICQIAYTAQHAVAELIQVAAMCQKTIDSLKK